MYSTLSNQNGRLLSEIHRRADKESNGVVHTLEKGKLQKCPIGDKCLTERKPLLKAVLDLINCQEAEIERLTESLDNLTSWFPTCDGCEGKTEEGARTDKCMYMTDISYCGKKATALYDRLKQQAETARSEAIKDVFREIESKCIDTFGNFNYKAFVNLKKEMVGEGE